MLLRLVTLTLACAFPAAANTLGLGSTAAPPGNSVSVPIEIIPTSPVVGVQFVVSYPTSFASTAIPGISSDSESDHTARSTDDSAGTRKIVVFSPTNSEFPAGFAVSVPVTLKPSSPSGGPSLEITDIIFTDKDGNTFPANAGYTLSETWRRDNFTLSERNDPTIIADDADPDGDGATNITELASGTNPRALTSAPIFELSGSSTTLGLRFSRATDEATRTAASIFAETSPDLQTWTTDGVAEAPTGTPGEIEATVPISSGPRFLRLSTLRNE